MDINKLYKHIALFFIFATLLFFGTFLGSIGHHYKFAFNFLLSFVLVYILLKKKETTALTIYICLSICLTITLFYITQPIAIFQLHTPSTLALPIGILSGFILYKTRFKYFLILAVLCLNFFVVFKGFNLWLNKINHGTFWGRVNYEWYYDNNLYDATNTVFQMEKDKTYVFDFWTTGCRNCFREFPNFEKIKENCKNSNIIFYAVNYKNSDETIEENLAFLKEQQVNVPTLFLKEESSKLHSEFQVRAFPTIIVIQNNRIIYKGGHSTLESFLEKL